MLLCAAVHSTLVTEEKKKYGGNGLQEMFWDLCPLFQVYVDVVFIWSPSSQLHVRRQSYFLESTHLIYRNGI